MTSVPWGDHLLSLEEWDQLEFTTPGRYELVEGVVLVVPKPAFLHQRAVSRLAVMLDAQLPAHLTAVSDVDVTLDPGPPATVRAPDVIVVPSALAETDPARVDARDVVIAVEVVSPGTRRTDLVTKPAEYAEAGIPHYWILDPHAGPVLVAQLLVDGGYEKQAEGTDVVSVLTPVPMTVTVPDLFRRGPAA